MSCLAWFQNTEITVVPNLSICFNDGKLLLSILDYNINQQRQIY